MYRPFFHFCEYQFNLIFSTLLNCTTEAVGVKTKIIKNDFVSHYDYIMN